MQGDTDIYYQMELGKLAPNSETRFLKKTGFFTTTDNLNGLDLDAKKPGFYATYLTVPLR